MNLGRNGNQFVRSDLSANREVIRGRNQKKLTLEFIDY